MSLDLKALKIWVQEHMEQCSSPYSLEIEDGRILLSYGDPSHTLISVRARSDSLEIRSLVFASRDANRHATDLAYERGIIGAQSDPNKEYVHLNIRSMTYDEAEQEINNLAHYYCGS